MTIGDRIKSLRSERKIAQIDLATQVGVSKQTLYKYENNIITNIPSDKIESISRCLGVSPAYLMGWSQASGDSFPHLSNLSPMPQTYKVPLLGKIACGQPILTVEEAEETAEVPAWVKADFALQCQGDSMMGARILDGDVVYIRAQDTVENGQIAAVLIKDNGTWEENATLKRYYQHPGLISLRAANPSYPDMDYVGEDMSRVRVLGLVVGFTSTKIK